MKKLFYAAMLLLGLSITNPCHAQDSDHKWLQGEWKNAVYGDIVDIYPNDSIRFLKNGLVFSKEDEEMWDWDYPMPKTINDLDGDILSHDKFHYTIGNWYGPNVKGGIKALLFDYLTGEYPFEPISTYLGIDNNRKQLFYYLDNGKTVFLTKTSDLVYEEQKRIREESKQREVVENNKNLPNEIAAHKFDWLRGQWVSDFMDMEHIVVNIDEETVTIERGQINENTGRFDVDRTQTFPFDLHYKINDFVHQVELVLVSDFLFVDKEGRGLYSYYDFDQPIDFVRVSGYSKDKKRNK